MRPSPRPAAAAAAVGGSHRAAVAGRGHSLTSTCLRLNTRAASPISASRRSSSSLRRRCGGDGVGRQLRSMRPQPPPLPRPGRNCSKAVDSQPERTQRRVLQQWQRHRRQSAPPSTRPQCGSTRPRALMAPTHSQRPPCRPSPPQWAAPTAPPRPRRGCAPAAPASRRAPPRASRACLRGGGGKAEAGEPSPGACAVWMRGHGRGKQVLRGRQARAGRRVPATAACGSHPAGRAGTCGDHGRLARLLPRRLLPRHLQLPPHQVGRHLGGGAGRGGAPTRWSEQG